MTSSSSSGARPTVRDARLHQRRFTRRAGGAAHGFCHIAGSHLLDPDTGAYTLPWVERVLGERPVAVVRLVHRELGLIVAPGNPLGLRGIVDLVRPRAALRHRQRGAGTRVLLDHELGRRGIGPDAVGGCAREEHTHLAGAAAVAAGRADCELGVLAAARAFGLSFVPVMREPYDVFMAAEKRDDAGSGAVVGAAVLARVPRARGGARRLLDRGDRAACAMTFEAEPR